MFKKKEIEDQLYLYNMSDVLTPLAVDIDFMKKSAKFNLNPSNFVMLALFSQKCTQKITKIELEFLTDVGKTFDFKKALRNKKSYLSILLSK